MDFDGLMQQKNRVAAETEESSARTQAQLYGPLPVLRDCGLSIVTGKQSYVDEEYRGE
jgi:hypothetical protein